VSRSHAKIVRTADGTVSVMDLASTNGTLVNGTPVDLATLHPGDRIQFGPDVVVRLSFVRSAPGPQASELSTRQLEVAKLVAQGRTNAQIAEELGISPRTVASHVDHIYARLGLSSRAALTRWVLEAGLDER
jgi:DNA-binding CsgD family transcriptional regulator